MAKLTVKGTNISVDTDQYISLTDIAKHKDSSRTDYLISNWLRNRNTIEFLGIWEQIHNETFNPIEFDGFRKNAGLKHVRELAETSLISLGCDRRLLL